MSLRLRPTSSKNFVPSCVLVGCGALGLVGCGAGTAERSRSSQVDESSHPDDGENNDDIVVDEEGGDGGSGNSGMCDRNVRLAEVAVGDPAPFDVVIVADHSDSLSWSREDLAAGLSDFLGQVRGHEVRFFVLTPTQYDETSMAARLPLGARDVVHWADPETGGGYSHAMTEYVQTCTTTSGETIDCPVEYAEVVQPYHIEGSWNFLMPDPVASISPAMNEAELDAQRLAISGAIIGLGLGGSSDEQPVCTLSRYIAQAPENLPEHAVFLVISDEDDQSDPADCVSHRDASAREQANSSYYRMQAPNKQGTRVFDCVPHDDQGNPNGEPVPMLWNVGSCTETRSCNAEELTRSRGECPASHDVSNCMIECTDGTANCTVPASSTTGDPCAGPFEFADVQWTDMQSYCDAISPETLEWSGCTFVEQMAGGFTFHDTVVPLSSATTVRGQILEFRAIADDVFSPEGYSVQLIGFRPEFSCAPQQGQSYLDNLSALVESDEAISPICADYSGAIARAQDFATELLENEYQLELDSDEELDAVRIVSSDGTIRELSTDDYSFDLDSGLLVINQSALHSTDEAIDLEVGEACVVR